MRDHACPALPIIAGAAVHPHKYVHNAIKCLPQKLVGTYVPMP